MNTLIDKCRHRLRLARTAIMLLCVAALLPILSSCADEQQPKPGAGVQAVALEPVRAAPASAYNTQVSTGATATGRRPAFPQSQIIVGSQGNTEAPQQPVALPPSLTQGEDVTLNFVNTDIREVVKAVFADYLKLAYTVDPAVQGQMTLQTGKPISRAAVVPVLEQALRLYGYVILQDGELFRVVPAPNAEGPGRVSNLARATPGSLGYASEIVPLQFLTSDQMLQILQSIAPNGSVSIADPNRNLLLVNGTAQERRAIINNISLFDVDWLSGMSFALFNPRFTDSKSLTRELNQIIGGKDGPLGRSVRFVTIDRLNLVMAISAQARHLEQLKGWVERLDRPGDSVERRIFVYRVQHGRAADLAKVLSQIIGQSSSGAVGGSPAVPTPGSDPRPQTRPVAASRINVDIDDGESDGLDYSPGDVGSLPVDGLGEVKISADETNNSLVILAVPRDYAVIEAALSKLDIVPLQVLLEAVVVEVTLSDALRYGVQYFYSQKNNQVALTNTLTNAIVPTLPGFSYIFSAGNNIRIILDALSSVTTVDVISSPEIMVLNNQTATLQVGDQVPVATQQAVSVIDPQAPLVNSIQYRDTGIILKVTPRVNQGGLVLLDIAQEVSDVAATTTSELNSPTIQQRKIQSSVAIRDNETVALGGLIRAKSTRSRGGIPVLQDIPVVGNLFKTTRKEDEKTELLVLITPRVVDSVQRARDVTDELRRKLPAIEALMNKSGKSNAR